MVGERRWREDEHADDRCHVLQAVDHQLARPEAEAPDERGDDRDQDQRDERRHALGHDDRKQHDDRGVLVADRAGVGSAAAKRSG